MKTRMIPISLIAFFILSIISCNSDEEYESLQLNTDVENENYSKEFTRSVGLTDLAIFKRYVNTNVYAIVYFWAPWCGPCKMMSPYFEELNNKHQNVEFIKVDIDEAEDIADFCNVRSIPTFIFYKNGSKIDVLEGAHKDKLKQMINSYYKYFLNIRVLK